jgi:hypothetical protein
MKLSDRIREEISKSGLVRWDDLEAEVFKLEKDIVRLEKIKNIIDEIQLQDTIYIGGIHSMLEMCRANSLDISTTTFILQLYNEHHIRIAYNGNEE